MVSGSSDYVKMVWGAGRIRCSDKASPEGNAFMESFFKTFKVEEVWLEDYENCRQADQSINRFIGDYNADRMHSSLGYLSPEESERLRSNDQP